MIRWQLELPSAGIATVSVHSHARSRAVSERVDDVSVLVRYRGDPEREGQWR